MIVSKVVVEKDLGTKFLDCVGKKLEVYNNWCNRLVEDAIGYYESKGISNLVSLRLDPVVPYLRPLVLSPRNWWYHVVIVDKEGLIHDAWLGYPVYIDEYLSIMFGKQEVISSPIMIDEIRKRSQQPKPVGGRNGISP